MSENSNYKKLACIVYLVNIAVNDKTQSKINTALLIKIMKSNHKDNKNYVSCTAVSRVV